MIRLILALGIMMTLSPSCGFADDFPSKIDEMLQSYFEGGLFQGNVLVTNGEKRIFEKSYGHARLFPKPQEIDESTRFRVASITKQFTAALILMFQERGWLHVEDYLSKFSYLADLPNANKIQIHHLLSHTSGYNNDVILSSDWQNTAWKETSLNDLLAKVKEIGPEKILKGVVLQPGKKMVYSNAGFIILAKIVEEEFAQHTGSRLPFSTIRRNWILKPAKLNNTGEFLSYEDEKLSEGYEYPLGINKGFSESPLQEGRTIHFSKSIGAFSMYSTARDLAKWHRVIYRSDKILSKASKDLMYSAHADGGDWGHYGYAVFIKNEKFGSVEKTHFWHHGNIWDGHITMYSRFPGENPSDDTVIVLLSNLKHTPEKDIARKIANILFNPKATMSQMNYSRPTSTSVSKELTKKLIGTYYELDEEGKKAGDSIALVSDRFGTYLINGWFGNQAIYPSENYLWHVETEDASVKFLTNSSGEVTGLKKQSRSLSWDDASKMKTYPPRLYCKDIYCPP